MKALDGHEKVVALLREALAALDEEGERLAAIHVCHALDSLGAPMPGGLDLQADGSSHSRKPGPRTSAS